MSIHGFNKETFAQKLGEVVFPSRPVRTIKHLFGREDYLVRIERALLQPGRNVFIFGDRGVGKSSLGATAAYQYQSPDAIPIFVSGSPDDTFRSIVANIANQAISKSRIIDKKTNKKFQFSWKGIGFDVGSEVSTRNLMDELVTIGDATDLFCQISKLHSSKPIVVLDEFDVIHDVKERKKEINLHHS